MGTKIVTLKSGHRGFYIKTNSKETFAGMGAAKPGDADNWSERQLWAPAFKVDHFGSATGSGDSSIAGLLSGFLRGLAIEDSLKYATCCGLQNVRVLDAVSGIKTWDETTKMIEQDMEMIDIHMNAKEWKWSDSCKLWAGPKDPLQ
jgi:sugar/nucleoside kinase (ribokinase family)